MHQIPREVACKGLLVLLRPLLRINFYLGTCPCLISPQGEVTTPWKYFNIFRFLFIVATFLLFSVASVVKVFITIYFAQQNPKDFEELTLTKFVDMSCGFYANLIPAVFMCLSSFKRQEILAFFSKLSNYAKAICGFSDHSSFKGFIQKLLIMHASFALITAVMIAARYITNPHFGPGEMVLWGMKATGINTNLLLWCASLFSLYMSCAKAAVTAFIEVACVSLSKCFCCVLNNLQVYLDDLMRNWRARFLEAPLTTSILQRHSDPMEKSDGVKSRKIQMDFENYLEQIRTYKDGQALVPVNNLQSHVNRRKVAFGESLSFQEHTPGQQIIYIVDKFQAVQNMQSATNTLFGCVLAINTGLMVFMCVVLKYMLIWNFRNSRNNEANGTFSGNDSTTSTYDGPPLKINMTANTPLELAMFAVINICFLSRLVVLVISLGNVHHASRKFNTKLAQALLHAQKIADIVDLQGFNKFFNGRQVLTPGEATTVLAFITENSANPVAFSAAGLFVFCRSLILVIISIMITYLVFLLQV